MRKIKFRAWDRKNKIMYLPEQISITLFPDDFYHIENFEDKVLIQPEFVNLIQYTGLKDKNGKEIYEEDIIYLNDGYEKAVVKFGKYTRIVNFYDHRSGCSTLLSTFSYGFYLEKYYSFDGKLECLPITYIELHSSYVVGNIYENQELLNDTK